MRNVGVIFLSKRLTSKGGNEYYSGKLEGSEGFNLMGFLKESQSGTKYMSLVATDDEESNKPEVEVKDKEEKKEAPKNRQASMDLRKESVVDNAEKIILPEDLPF